MSNDGPTMALLKTYRVEVLLPITTEEHISPCEKALDYLAGEFPEGCTLSRAAPPLSDDLGDGFPAWSGRYTHPATQEPETDAHILFLGHWSRHDNAEAEVCRRLTSIERQLHGLYAEQGYFLGLRDVYQIEIFVQVTNSHLALVDEGVKNERVKEKELLPVRAKE